ncbi:MAG TPA: YlxR family protein [Thermomicrobiales bacterium]|jgi:predicted RNA-binding protein YlxR (DUF448 family)
MATANASAKPRGKKGPRPKHVPQRMCVSCRERSAKRTLVRIVRTPEGTVEIDPTGKRNGRGAYLCDDPACWERALRTGALANALKTTIDPETVEMLRGYAATLTPVAADGGAQQEGTNE